MEELPPNSKVAQLSDESREALRWKHGIYQSHGYDLDLDTNL